MQIIAREQDLREFIQHVETQKVVACDTESVRVRTYYPDLALIQMATSARVALIDPTVIEDFTDLKRLFENKEIVKIFHAPRQDVELLRHALEIQPCNIFDTQIAASLMGMPDQVGYETMTREVLEIQLDKSSQFTDWLVRPLSEAQLEYAAADVTHLLTIYHVMLERLEERYEWALDLCADYDKEEFYRVDLSALFSKWATRLKKDDERMRLWIALKWREARAQKINRPRLWIMKDADILAIAKGEMDNAPPPLKRLIQIPSVQDQNEVKNLLKGHLKPLNEKQKILYSTLRDLCNQKALEHGVPPRFLACKTELENYVRQKTKPAVVPWKNHLFWDHIESALCATSS